MDDEILLRQAAHRVAEAMSSLTSLGFTASEWANSPRLLTLHGQLDVIHLALTAMSAELAEEYHKRSGGDGG